MGATLAAESLRWEQDITWRFEWRFGTLLPTSKVSREQCILAPAYNYNTVTLGVQCGDQLSVGSIQLQRLGRLGSRDRVDSDAVGGCRAARPLGRSLGVL